MLRTDIARGLATILAAVDHSDVLAVTERVYRDITRQAGEVKMPELLESYQKFLLAYSGFTAAERQMMKQLEIHEFAETDWWSTVIAAASGGAKSAETAGAIGHPLFRLRFVVDYVPAIIAMLKRDNEADVRPGQLTLILPEEQGKFSSPARVAGALEAVATLYEALAELNVQSTTDLVLTGCDSGADKQFEFHGLPNLIEKLKELLLDLWDNAIYFREKRFAERQDLIAKNLPIIAHIASLEEKAQLQPERAELLRRKFIAGASRFFEMGASIPEMSKFANYQPRTVLAPKETLLLAARG